MTDVAAVEAAIADAHRSDWAGMLAATVRVARDLDLAEESVQEAYASAMKTWVSAGIPDNPAAWLTTTAKRRSIDAIRRDRAFRSRLPLLVEPEEALDEVTMDELTDGDAGDRGEVLPDERLRLIFDASDEAFSVAVSPSGDTVFVTGQSMSSTAGYDYATVAYRYNGSGGDDLARSVAVSPSGDAVFVTGQSVSSTAGYDYATIAYNAATGARLWVRRYNGPGNGGDAAASVAVNPGGGMVVVTGQSQGSTSGDDYATISYSG